jgi:hypothetical protein
MEYSRVLDLGLADLSPPRFGFLAKNDAAEHLPPCTGPDSSASEERSPIYQVAWYQSVPGTNKMISILEQVPEVDYLQFTQLK